MASVYPLPSLTLALQGWPRLGRDAAAFIRPLAPSAPSHSPWSAVPSIAMATVGAVDGKGCLEWQPWQESGPSDDPGGEGKETKMAEEKERARNRSMPLQSRVIMVMRFKDIYTVTSLCPPLKGQPRSTVRILKYGNHMKEFRLSVFSVHQYFLKGPFSLTLACASANAHSLIRFQLLILPRPWHWTEQLWLSSLLPIVL